MEENVKIWDKTTNDLTVKDQLVLTAGMTAAVVGVLVVVPAVTEKVKHSWSSFKSLRANRKQELSKED